MVMRAFLAGRSIRIRPTEALRSLRRRYSRTCRSSPSIRENSRPLANQREFQLRETESRKPVGLIFWPMIVLLALAVADRDIDVAALLADPRTPSLGARRKAAQRRSLLHQNTRDPKLVDIGAVVVFGVRDRRFQRLADQPGRLLRRKAQDVQRLVDRLAPNQVSHQATFLRRNFRTADRCSCLHLEFPWLRAPTSCSSAPQSCDRQNGP